MTPVLVFLVMEHSFGDDWETDAPVAACRSLEAAYGFKREAERIEAERDAISGLRGRHYEVRYLELIG